MNSKDAGLSAADLVRRFKEGKPTSREEREQQRQSTGNDRMWWESEGGKMGKESSDRPPRSVTPPSVRSAPRYGNPEPETMEEPRRQFLKSPMVQSSKRDLSASSELFRNSMNMGNSMDVDYLIEKEIRNLEKDIKKKESETMRRLNMGSFTPQRGLNQSFENGLNVGTSFPSPARYRPTLREQGGLRGTSDPRQEEMFSRSADMFRSSADTLGSTGILGLLRADLKLDGRKDLVEEEKNKDDGNKTSNPSDVQIDLDALMKNLKEFLPEEKPSYLPDGVDETIPQITNRLQCQMMEFMTLYNGAMIREKEKEDEQKKRDEEMKEEGRRLERERRLLEFDIPPFQHPLDYVNGDNTIPADGAARVGNFLSGALGRDTAAENGNELSPQGIPAFADDPRRWQDTPGNARFVSRMLDFEMQQANATYSRMRQVRHQMDSQLHRMNHASQDPYHYANERNPRYGGGGSSIRMSHSRRNRPEEEVDDGRGGYGSDTQDDDLNFDPVRMQHDQQYRDRILQRRSRRRQQWNPYPEILPENIFNTSKAVESMLNSAMETLHRRLPEKRQPIPMTAPSSVSPRPATPMPSQAQRDAALTPVPSTPHSSTPVPTTPGSVSSHGSNSTQQSITTATNTALNARSPAPAIPTTSTAPSVTMVKPIATTPSTTAIAKAAPAVVMTKPFPELKSDTSSQIERLVDNLVATAKEKVASGGTAPGSTKLDVSNTSLGRRIQT